MPDPSPELMGMMQGGGGAAPESPAGPVSSPMTTPQPNVGEQQNARTQVQMAIKLLEQSLGPLGSSSDEGKAILESLKKLGSKFFHGREKHESLIPSEVMNLVSGLPQGMTGGAMGAGGPPAAPPGAAPAAPPTMM